MPFSAFRFSEPLLRAVTESGYNKPTPIQTKAIPAVLAGKDVMAAAQTGTGKTASYTLPLLQRLLDGPAVKSNHIRVLVLTPTRELAVQIEQSIKTYGKYLPLKSAVVYGGVKINPQMKKLRGGVDLLVATPGRLLDLFSQNTIKFDQVKSLVLDEADRMLDMGFIDDISKIMSLLPKKRQNLLLSATFSAEIRTLAKKLLNNPLSIDVSPRNSAAKSIKQWVLEVDKSKKSALLSHLIRNNNLDQVLVFTRTKIGADELVKYLKSENHSAIAIHGGKTQGVRKRALSAFKENKVRILVATDIAARGLDINELPHVVNFDLPKVAEDYVHRIGRTGRAGLQGEGISLVSADEVNLLAAIESLIQQTLTREVESGFVPNHKVPLTQQTKIRPKKPKKPKIKVQQGNKQQTAQKPQNTGRPRRGSKPQESGQQKETVAGRGRQRRKSGPTADKKRGPTKTNSGQRTR